MTSRALLMLPSALVAMLVVGCDDPVESSPDIIVDNASSVSITQVFIRDCPIKFWGENRLEGGEVIRPSDRRRFGVGAGCFDVLLYFDTERTIDMHNIDVPSGEAFVWTVDGPELAPGRPE
jgi:hypothetical protein